MRAEALLTSLLLLYAAAIPSTATAASGQIAPSPSSLGGILLPRADGLQQPVIAGTLVTFPPTFLVQYERPLGRVTVAGALGVGILPDLFAGGVVILPALRPTGSRWGLGMAGYWGGILGPSHIDREWDDSGLYGVHGLFSSPLRRARIHLGAGITHVFHPLGSGAAVVSLMGEVRVGGGSLSGEFVFIRLFEETDSGGDFHALALLGAHLPSGRAVVHIGAGILLLDAGGWSEETWPAPPILSVTLPFDPGGSD